jgi:hypothetical protein
LKSSNTIRASIESELRRFTRALFAIQRSGPLDRDRKISTRSSGGQNAIEFALYHRIALANPRFKAFAIQHGDVAATALNKTGGL